MSEGRGSQHCNSITSVIDALWSGLKSLSTGKVKFTLVQPQVFQPGILNTLMELSYL